MGKTIAEAFQDCIDRGTGDFYYENYIIYAIDLSGLDYYPAELNNWHWDTHTEIFNRVNTFYVPEGTVIEELYVDERITFKVEEIGEEYMPAKMQVLLIDRVSK